VPIDVVFHASDIKRQSCGVLVKFVKHSQGCDALIDVVLAVVTPFVVTKAVIETLNR
jgi:hypothetical protein